MNAKSPTHLSSERKQHALVPRCFLQLYAPGFVPRNGGSVGTPMAAFADAEFCAEQAPELLARIEQSLHSRLKRALEIRRPGVACVLASEAACATARRHAQGPLAKVLDAHAERYPNAPLELNHLVALRQTIRLGTHRLLQLGHFLDAAVGGRLAAALEALPGEKLPRELLERLSVLAEGPAGDLVTLQERRFGPLLGNAFPQQENLRVALASATEHAIAHRNSAEQLALELEGASKATVADEIWSVARLLAAGRNHVQRDADWFARRYGVQGHAQSTLQAIGSVSGLTRERVRQVVDRLMHRLRGRTVYLPATMNALAAIDVLLPTTEPALNAAMAERLGASLEVASLFEFAVDIGALQVRTDLAFIRPRDDVRMAAHRHSYTWAKACGALAGKMVSSVGAAQLHWLTGVLAQRGHRVSPDEVLGVISSRLGFDWLDKAGGWFWFGPEETENRVLNAVTKILAVAVRNVDCDELYAGFARSRARPRPSALPGELFVTPEVFHGILARTPLFRLSQLNNFALVAPMQPHDVLSETEWRLCELMRERDGVASRYELQRIMVDQENVNFATFSVAVDRSPILRNVDYGVYALVGWQVEPPAYKRAWQQVGGTGMNGRKAIVEPDHDGWFRFATEFRQGVIKNRQFSLPAALTRALPDGDYVLPPDWGSRVLKKSDDRLSGVVREALNARWPVGTPLLIELHPALREARLSVEAKAAVPHMSAPARRTTTSQDR